jgi:hypothetical protein
VIRVDIDEAAATDDELIASYLEAGFSEETARAYVAVIRNPGEYFVD